MHNETFQGGNTTGGNPKPAGQRNVVATEFVCCCPSGQEEGNGLQLAAGAGELERREEADVGPGQGLSYRPWN